MNLIVAFVWSTYSELTLTKLVAVIVPERGRLTKIAISPNPGTEVQFQLVGSSHDPV